MTALGQRATYRYVVTTSDMPLATEIGVHVYWVIQVARWHGETRPSCSRFPLDVPCSRPQRGLQKIVATKVKYRLPVH